MYNILQPAHSGLMWLIVIMLVLSVVFSLIKFLNNDEKISTPLFKLYDYTKQLLYIQFILGVVLLFISPLVMYTSGFMKNEVLRFQGLEHPLMMLIAVGLVATGLFKSKTKTTSKEKNKMIFIFYSLALVIILLMVPWKTVLS
ncbi:MAG: hypothetical protein Q8O72_12530 [Bacteroidales bacterium]|nr:hypothetical protein [Bacteroidales bacterium]